MTVTPAYGRDYKSAKEVKAAWNEGKDFVITDIFGGQAGRYINKSDADKVSDSIMVRYCRLTKVVRVK